jgi:putative transcriptional regulator
LKEYLTKINEQMKNTIKVERAKMDITQGDLAEVLKVSRQTIHAIETGKFVPSTLLSLKMAKFFNTTVEEIFTIEDGD